MESIHTRVIASAHKPTLMDHIRNFNIKGIWEYIKSLNYNWMQLGLVFLIGGLTGFLCRKYFKSVFIWVICGLGLIAALDLAGLIAVDWNVLQQLVGVTPGQSFDTVLQPWIACMKVNLSLVVAGFAGFIIGLKVG